MSKMPPNTGKSKRASDKIDAGTKGFVKRACNLAKFDTESDCEENERDFSVFDLETCSESADFADCGEISGVPTWSLKMVEDAGDEYRALYRGNSRSKYYRDLQLALEISTEAANLHKITDHFERLIVVDEPMEEQIVLEEVEQGGGGGGGVQHVVQRQFVFERDTLQELVGQLSVSFCLNSTLNLTGLSVTGVHARDTHVLTVTTHLMGC